VCLPGRPARLTRPRWPSIAHDASDPAPLSTSQLRALVAAAGRELVWGLPAVAHEVKYWSHVARQIPDLPIRHAALTALTEKRAQTDGAALFSILPQIRSITLLRLLTAYQIIWDFLDSVHERAPTRQNGRLLHRALIDALDPERPISNYYRYHTWSDDGGYLRALVTVCRERCVGLPCYEQVRAIVIREAVRAQVLTLNHDPDLVKRKTDLKRWAIEEFPGDHEALWFELSGAASAGLTVFALLALAAEPTCHDSDIARVYNTYFPWTSAMATMLDSYVDQLHDRAKGDHIYISHYGTPELAVEHICKLVRRGLREARRLKNGDRHVVIAASMVAMYLSKDSARTPAMHEATRRILRSGGSLTRVLHPILRLWRTTYGLRSA
jgi:tetraprenyl-beta-curcumene synthase